LFRITLEPERSNTEKFNHANNISVTYNFIYKLGSAEFLYRYK